MTGPFSATDEGLVVTVRLTPNAARDEFVGVETGPDDRLFLKIKVRAVPEKGKANKALCSFLAKSLGLPKTSFTVISGSKSRWKTVLVSGRAAEIESKFKKLLARG